ncbi:MAG: hypothetical protein ABJA10_07565 [Aestuariivirga sp.]
MANENRGEVALVLGEATYTLLFSVNALCNLEDRMGKPINEILSSMGENTGLKMLRSLLQCGLSQRHPEITEAIAGDLLSFGNTQVVTAKIGEALALAFPAPTGSEAGSATENPK